MYQLKISCHIYMQKARGITLAQNSSRSVTPGSLGYSLQTSMLYTHQVVCVHEAGL